MRQSDPERGKSPWRRGVRQDQLVLVCPACQESGDWTAELESCIRCGSAHLIRRLGQVECLDCGLIREPEPVLVTSPARAQHAGDASGLRLAAEGSGHPGRSAGAEGDSTLAEEVGRALDRLLGRR
ncbi:MAG: hypothetical protein M3Z75_08515 [Actinomycetota bacterium]|nr:hypothetical protein [Actinomycetota bacterium]